MRRNLRKREVPQVLGDDSAGSTCDRGSNNVFVVGIGQPEGAFVWLPVFDQRVVERGCHLVNQVTRPHGRNIRLFSPVY